jgi:hypothetical protein
MYDIIFVGKKNNQFNKLKSRFPFLKITDSVAKAKELSVTKMYWIVWDDLEVEETFEFDYKVPKWDEKYVHIFKNGEYYDGICLLHKNLDITEKEFKHRFFVNKKEINVLASIPKTYDIFDIDSHEDYQTALTSSTTDMFWATSRNLVPAENFKFDFYFSHHNISDRNQNHAFLHRNGVEETYNGIFLLSKSAQLTEKEIQHRFPVQRREWDIVASIPREYPKRNSLIETYQDYEDMLKNSDSTELFWVIPRDVEVNLDFKFDFYFSHDNDFDRKINHVFLNGNDYDGVMLLSKHSPISEREFKTRFIVNKKEWAIQASSPKPYDLFYIDTYEEYLEAMNRSSTEMFWGTSRNIKIDEKFKFDFYISHHNTIDRNENHAFIHRMEEDDLYNGLFLFSKNKPVSKKEIEYRNLIERKEWDIVASGPVVYDLFYVDTYEQYLEAMNKSNTEMFWMTTRNLQHDPNFKFDVYFDHSNEYDRNTNHAFIHRVDDYDTYNGIFLMSKNKPVSKKEIEYRNLIDRKEWAIIASGPVVYEKYVY